MIKAIAVRVPAPYLIEVAFKDGTKRTIDLEGELYGEVFAPLTDPALFAQAKLDPIAGSVYWPTGADLAPEFLYFGEAGPPPGYYHQEHVVEPGELRRSKG